MKSCEVTREVWAAFVLPEQVVFAGANRNPSELTDSEKNSINDLEEMPQFQPNCAEGCLKHFLLTLRASLVSGNNYERLTNTCEKLRQVYECLDRLKKCQPSRLFRMLMDGFKYMCIEHPADCEQKCKAHNLIAGWFIYSAMHSTKLLHDGGNGAPPRVNIGFLRKITSEACSISPKLDKDLKEFYKNRTEPLIKFRPPVQI
uniref:CPG4 domain-containing protein n=1 Tax=Elaeophora elaphi TaxID=1147741 RepID=A0A0R3RYV4_9BILA